MPDIEKAVELEDHVITQEDLDNNPDLVKEGVKIGDVIGLPKGVYQEAQEKAEAKEKDATEESFERLRPMVFSIIELVAKERLPIGNNTKEQDDLYFKAAETVLKTLLDGNMKYVEKEQVFALLLQPFDKIRTIVLDSLNRSANRALDIRMGKSFAELTLPDLHEIIRSQAPAEAKA